MSSKDEMYDEDFVDQFKKINEINQLYCKNIALLNRYFVFDKRHASDTFQEDDHTYKMFQLSHQPTGLINTHDLLEQLPDFKEQDIAAATISLEQHLQIYGVILQSLIKSEKLLADFGNVKDEQVDAIEDSVDQLLTQYEKVDDQLLLDCRALQDKAPEKIFYAYAVTDLDNIQGLDDQTVENMKELIVQNHQTIQNAQSAIDKANKVNEVLKGNQDAIAEAKKEE